jgi:hypothetical protein
LEILKVDTERD